VSRKELDRADYRLSVIAAVLCLGLMTASAALAVDPDTRLTQYGHTAWRIREGQIPGSPNAITQTRDGYIWLGTEGGLLRFNGYQFTRFQPATGKSLHSQTVVSLAAGTDGSLLVGTALGLDIVQGSKVRQINANERARIDQVLISSRGEAWYVRARIRGDNRGPLCVVSGGEQRCLGTQEGIDARYAVGITEDPNGDIWIAGPTALIRWSNGSATTYTSPRFARLNNLAGFGSIVEGGSGRVFVGLMQSGPGLGLQEFSNGHFKTLCLPSFDGTAIQTTRLRHDRHGALWIGTANNGVYRIYRSRVDHYRASDGLSGDSIRDIFEDREGVVWISTTRGIDNFRDLRVRTLSTLEGLSSDFTSGLAVAKDGSVWVGSMYGLNIIRSGSISHIDRSNGLPGDQVMGIAQDARGNWWMGIDQNLVRYSNGRFEKIESRGSSWGPVIALSAESSGIVWAVTGGTSPALLQFQNGRLTQEHRSVLPKTPTAVLADAPSSVWVGYSNGTVSHLNHHSQADIEVGTSDKDVIRQLLTTNRESILAITTMGLFGIGRGHVEQLGTRNGLPSSVFKSGIFDRTGDLWLYGELVLLHIKQADLDRWWHNPATIVPFSFLSNSDGLLVSDNPFSPPVGVTPDNKLWFATGQSGVEIIDPAMESLNRLLPPIQIEQFEADHTNYTATGAVMLPPLTRSIQVRFAGLSFQAPGDLRFRYRLDGYDKQWSEASTSHHAYFENLKPGRYHFRVTSSNSPGVWNPQEADLTFVIAPTWYQTRWFTFLIVVVILSAISSLYRLRVRAMSAALNARFDERLAERTRMAREFHDTFLQTIQGSKMVADDALVPGATAERMRNALTKLSLWLGQSITEGRAALQALRASSNEQNQVVDSLRRAVDELGTGSIKTEMRTSGAPRQLHPIVRDELLQIGFEAIRNASRHSEAKRIKVEITYQGSIHLQVVDNGIGIPEEYIAQGKEGHFGLIGMRERVDRMNGRISIIRRPEGGTEVLVVIPGAVAYRYPEQESLFSKILSSRLRKSQTKWQR
jgi:signal transduction histidine kinase/ligand-binding sensor domain-containing protein